MTRVAAIDCGTNSIRLLVTDLRDGAQHDLDRRLRIVRLGKDVDRTGVLAREALDRTFETLREYAAVIGELGAEHVRMVATSATRDAANRDEFVAGVADVLGVEPEVVSGAAEAGLSFDGAVRGLPGGDGAPYLVVDIGGGSTELALGSDGVTAARSVDIGCVRLTERRFQSDPPTSDQVAAARADIEAALSDAAAVVPLGDARTLVGLAGSVTTVAAIHLGLAEYDSAAIHHSRVPAAQVRAISDHLLTLTHDERLAIGPMHPGRADVIAAGALVLRCVVDRAGVDEVLVSEHDILDGIAWSVVSG
ncbi:Ppx/GppA phosphatase family protein [Jiangella sp. DSM 45060]|uniref:Ppx/GppA phosphatase family protein n=1 Tax=Jiangella sp. DSM 45060 TaxID=1798224 RepID=UPI00087B1E67|nr:Ppx/GppA phosphatase family protein [Jiangella sp. DSM 45060]SDT57837.1 exopolyphosphatase / guanosine-5'-triphosphate,3'-diphosphate pyrophosphatase [Jiangella sp. DSM 45060]